MYKNNLFSLFALMFLPLLLSFNNTQPEQQEKWKAKFGFTTVKDNPATPVKDQANSGTCWDYAGVSFVESEMLRQGKQPIDLAEMFIVYHAYLDKARRYVRMHGNATFSPGGEGHDVLDAIRLYGIVPQEAYSGLVKGETRDNHREMDRALSSYVKGVVEADRIRGEWEEGVKGLLNRYLGRLPEQFTYQGKEYDPVSFAREVVDINPDDYLYFMSWTDLPYYRENHLLVPDNWSWEKYYNLPLDDMIRTLDYALENGYTVLWAADMTETGFSVPLGIAVVPETTDTLKMFDGPQPEKTITEQMRQDGFDDYSTLDDHSMHITGIARDVNGKKYYIIKNSWGTETGFDGLYYVSEAYMRYKTISMVLHRDGVPKDILKKLK